jgi:hypothetical protein
MLFVSLIQLTQAKESLDSRMIELEQTQRKCTELEMYGSLIYFCVNEAFDGIYFNANPFNAG